MLEVLCSSVVALLYGPNTLLYHLLQKKNRIQSCVLYTAIIPIDYSLC